MMEYYATTTIFVPTHTFPHLGVEVGHFETTLCVSLYEQSLTEEQKEEMKREYMQALT